MGKQGRVSINALLVRFEAMWLQRLQWERASRVATERHVAVMQRLQFFSGVQPSALCEWQTADSLFE